MLVAGTGGVLCLRPSPPPFHIKLALISRQVRVGDIYIRGNLFVLVLFFGQFTCKEEISRLLVTIFHMVNHRLR